MSKIQILVYGQDGQKTFYPYPWSIDEFEKVAKKGGRLAEILGFPVANHICSVSDLPTIIPTFVKIYHYINNTEFDVVYSDSEINAVRALFQNDLELAISRVFNLKNVPGLKMTFIFERCSWWDILDYMKSKDKFISLGADYFAGFTLERS
ncbi:putative signal-transduction protein with CBS domains [Weissella oryzae SG25]|uniref:Putative signal-transduction protein with CBS domains n=1 Tax=Weissella oryzae (strain DSM 25784 / JCM 18191 / LMG 30913 / SG25) TaxID=1329250 RepID=A0A069CU60_WEIOS|nr:hypothetical protein [Weissella oryzae]GAK30753.1 putative signal-transduction protein with CBS domains [Weissella oryzae SG25]